MKLYYIKLLNTKVNEFSGTLLSVPFAIRGYGDL